MARSNLLLAGLLIIPSDPDLMAFMIDQFTSRYLPGGDGAGQTEFPAGESIRLQAETGTRMRTLAVTSGKGGVGKSNIAVNVALELAAIGHFVSLLDADLALANADLLLGLSPQYHLGHVLAGQRTLEEVIIDVTQGLRLIPGGSGMKDLANVARTQQTRLVGELRQFEIGADCMIIDTATGIGENVTEVLRAADEVIIVTTPDPASIVDSYAMIKVMHQKALSKPVWVIVNEVVEAGDADRIFDLLQAAATQFLDCELMRLGAIPRDAKLAEAVRRQIPVVMYAPDAPASQALRVIARQLAHHLIPGAIPLKGGGSFWSSLIALNLLRSH